MGRRERGPGRRAELSSSTWETIRRALGRLASQAGVRRLSPEEMTPPVALRASAAVGPPVVLPGRDERLWKLNGEVRDAPVPQAGTGMREGNLLPSVSLIPSDAALALPICRAMAVLGAVACPVAAAGLDWPVASAGLPKAFLTLPPAPVRVESARLPGMSAPVALQERRLEGWRVDPPKSGALRLPRLAGPRIRWGSDAVLSRMALTRRGREAPPGIPFALAFPSEALRLAEAAHLPPEDVDLLGVYPGVPLLAVSRIVVADGGRRLRLWLKPEVLRGRNGGRLITLLVGRQNSTGKMLQAAL